MYVYLFKIVKKYYCYLHFGAGAQSVPINRLVKGSIPTRGDEIFIYIKFSFLRSGVEVKARR